MKMADRKGGQKLNKSRQKSGQKIQNDTQG